MTGRIERACRGGWLVVETEKQGLDKPIKVGIRKDLSFASRERGGNKQRLLPIEVVAQVGERIARAATLTVGHCQAPLFDRATLSPAATHHLAIEGLAGPTS